MTDPSMSGSAGEFARAKVNLALHITGRRDDGYHLLDSLVVFPAIGDRLHAEAADGLSLTITGPFSVGLAPNSDNLVLKAIRSLATACGQPEPGLALTLEKNLPVASGIGGGSADAAAALRLARNIAGMTLPRPELEKLALQLGADVPVCLDQCAVRMKGIGESLSHLPRLPDFGIVLVNPRLAVSTPAIFKGLENRNNSGLPDIPAGFETLTSLISYLEDTRNDMQATAERLCPVISQVLAALSAEPQTLLSRMSGSGATCFALCRSGDEDGLAARIQKSHPAWWVASSNSVT
ncbi:4-(cytidine 5'-diphospho)-2-C-methyl-D-erythritol kinase [uncultured Roseibium sp.]|uniref:4-(cytidine 5'-diphospho)-2-C-methyl-D-erythritol kinase n=1 Tax=uncultured Roseibium sp. TaxID=1936171 RepID=UPI0025965703|nr:4-(cytidine 5'-diphospho)-2-C-methyl-D-erythritol kinase [uncultured Roseibium sp.]